LILAGKAQGYEMRFEDISMSYPALGAVVFLDRVLIGALA